MCFFYSETYSNTSYDNICLMSTYVLGWSEIKKKKLTSERDVVFDPYEGKNKKKILRLNFELEEPLINLIIHTHILINVYLVNYLLKLII